jgi:protein-S-isoprenylcysteine O-methyltransferase Ste14
MVYFVPLAFTTWLIFSFLGSQNWMLGTILYNPFFGLILMYIFEIVLILGGCTLFIWGIIIISQTRKNKEGIATTGPYKWIRHPQHLGIILSSLAIPLYSARVAGILSWSLFALVLLIISIIEEKKLISHFGDDYLEYMAKTGFLLPRISKYVRKPKTIEEVKFWKKYLFLTIGYIVFVAEFRLIIFALQKSEVTRIVYTIESLPSKYWYVNIVLIVIVILSIIIKKYRVKYSSKTIRKESEKSTSEIKEE